jgi:site-specific DNA-cytosine methylase
MKALELYCGIGGFAAAVRDQDVEIVGAVDISSHVVQSYNRNWEPVAEQCDLLSLSAGDVAAYGADLWWMSPPCAPYTRRGNKQDLDDHRAESFVRVLGWIDDVRPEYVALENVEGFARSRAREVLLESLAGYDVVERVICPTELGIPNKRPRYYLLASRYPLTPVSEVVDTPLEDWREYLDGGVDDSYRVPERVVEKYGSGFHVMTDDESYTTCFTGSYGKSWNFTGSYMPTPDGGLRLFTPREVRRFLGFPDSFTSPESHSRKQRWKYAGNSLSVPAVREVLRPILGRQWQGPSI